MSVTTCRTCGRPLRAGIRVCTNCGTPITPSQEGLAQEGLASPTGPITGPQPSIPGQPVATAPATGDRVIRLTGRRVAVLGAVTALLLIGAIAAGAMTAPERELAGELIGQLPFDEDGGTQDFDDGKGQIKVPQGALDGPETIEVRRDVVRQPVRGASPTGAQISFPPGALVVYIFGPTTLTFDRPVTIILPLPVNGQTGLIFITDGGDIRFLSGTVSGGSIRIQLNSFDLSDPGAVVRT